MGGLGAGEVGNEPADSTCKWNVSLDVAINVLVYTCKSSQPHTHMHAHTHVHAHTHTHTHTHTPAG